MNYVVWWLVCDGQLYMCLWWMIVGQVMVVYLSISLCLSLLVMMNVLFWMAMYCFKFLLWILGHHILFYLLCEYNMSYCISFHGYIYLFTHTCCTPWIAKFRGSFCLDVCKSCIDDSNWNSNSCIHQGGALHKFWVSKALNSFILIKA